MTMKNILYKALACTPFLILTACNDGENSRDSAEARERDKVGKVYNPKVQGIEHENQKNQFFISRNKDIEDAVVPEMGIGIDTATVAPDSADTSATIQQPANQQN